jgi:hypothetical protein
VSQQIAHTGTTVRHGTKAMLEAALNESVYPQLLKPWVNHQYMPQHLFLTVNRLGLQLYDLVLITYRSKRCR